MDHFDTGIFNSCDDDTFPISRSSKPEFLRFAWSSIRCARRTSSTNLTTPKFTIIGWIPNFWNSSSMIILLREQTIFFIYSFTGINLLGWVANFLLSINQQFIGDINSCFFGLILLVRKLARKKLALDPILDFQFHRQGIGHRWLLRIRFHPYRPKARFSTDRNPHQS